MQLLTFSGESQGAEVFRHDIPAELRDEAELWREQMLEQLFEFSNELAELVLEKEPVPGRIWFAGCSAMPRCTGLIVPVLCGSALDHVGIQPLLGRGDLLSAQPGRQAAGRRHQPQEARRQGDPQAVGPDEPFCGLVFKIDADKHGDLHYVRVYSGELKAGSRALQPRQGQEGKRPAALAHSGRPPRAGAQRLGRRHRGRHRPAALDHRRHALRSASTRSCWRRSSFPRRSSRWPSSRRARPSARSWPTCWK